MGFWRSESLIETLARQTGWLIVEREDDYYRLRPIKARTMNYLGIRSPEDSAYVNFRTDLPVQFPAASAPPDLFRLLLFRNDTVRFGRWAAGLTNSCDIAFFQLYTGIKAGITPSLFDRIGRDMLDEREAFHTELNNQLTRLTPTAGSVGWQGQDAASLPTGGRTGLPVTGQHGIGWTK